MSCLLSADYLAGLDVDAVLEHAVFPLQSLLVGEVEDYRALRRDGCRQDEFTPIWGAKIEREKHENCKGVGS